MMQTTRNHLVAAAIGMASLAGVSTSQADDKLSGSLALDVNSHFISYGLDVWGNGDEIAPVVNPSLSIDYAITDSLTLNTGFWLDLNNQLGGDASGGGFQNKETDVWIGLAYTAGIATFSATLQDWQYAGDSEEILDVGVSFDTFLSPSLLWHNRLSPGASGGFNGSFLVGSIEHGIDVSDCFSISIPVSVGFALSEFHTTEDGYGYASIGLQGSYSLSDSTSLNFGVTYYDTDEDVVANAAEDSFFTYNAGMSFSF